MRDVAYKDRTMMRIAGRAASAATMFLGVLLGSVDLSADELPDVADLVQASVVSIIVEKTRTAPPAQRTDQDADATKSNLRQGTGMVYSADGYIITVTGLVDNVGKITIVFADGKQASAQVVGRDPRMGIASLEGDLDQRSGGRAFRRRASHASWLFYLLDQQCLWPAQLTVSRRHRRDKAHWRALAPSPLPDRYRNAAWQPRRAALQHKGRGHRHVC